MPEQFISVPARRINEIVQGKRGVTADTALRLACQKRLYSGSVGARGLKEGQAAYAARPTGLRVIGLPYVTL